MASVNTSGVSGGLNVQDIVSGLMSIARAPIAKLESQIESKSLVVSTLGTFKSKVSALETASKKIQDAWLYSSRSSSSTDASKVSSSVTSTAREGAYTVKIAQTAQAEMLAIPGFSRESQRMDLSDFQLTFQGNTYSARYADFAAATYAAGDKITFTVKGGSAQSFTVTDETTPEEVAESINAAVADGTLEAVNAFVNEAGRLQLNTSNPLRGLTATLQYGGVDRSDLVAEAREGIPTDATLQDVKDMINLLDAGIEASIVQIKSGSYSLGVSSKETGSGNTISISGVATQTTVAQESSLTVSGTYAENEVITVTLDGTVVTYTVRQEDIADGGSSADDHERIATQLAQAITNAGVSSPAVTASNGVLSFVATTAGDDFSLVAQSSAAGGIDVATEVENLSATDLRAVSFAATVGTPDNDSYTLSYNGTAWTVTGAATSGATFDGSTLVTSSGATIALNLTGAAKAGDAIRFSISGLPGAQTYSDPVITEHAATRLQSGRDAFISVNGLAVQRSTNSISDVISGVTFNLNSPVMPAGGEISALTSADFSAVAATTVNVTRSETDSATTIFQSFVTAFNDLVTYYREQSVSSMNAESRGVLNGDFSTSAFMSRLQGLYRNGIRLSDGSSLSFSEIGISVQRDGKLLLSDGDFADALTNGLQSKLAQGVTLGYESASVNFVKYLTDSLKSDGILTSRVDAVEDEQTRLQDKISELEDKMSVLETRYYKQYAALDGLLMRLQATQSALSSALAGLESTRNNK